MPLGRNEPGFLPAATRPCIAQAVDWVFEEAPPVSDHPPVPCWDERSHLTAALICLLPPGAAASAWTTAPVLSGSLTAPETDPQPPFLFWILRSHCADLASFERSTLAARWARIA